MRCRSFVTPENVVLGIHEKISALSARVKKYRYMGTTLSVLLLCERTAHIIHVGDSRIYRAAGRRSRATDRGQFQDRFEPLRDEKKRSAPPLRA